LLSGVALSACSSSATGVGAAAKLAFFVQPTSTPAGYVITPAVQVTAQDASGNTATGFTGTVTVAIGANPGGGTLAGTTTVAAVNGIASFTNLRLDRAGTGCTLNAGATGLAGATSTAFNIAALYVANFYTITVYAVGVSVNATPAATIAGSNTGLGAQGIAHDGAGNIYASNTTPPSITVYAAGASGNAAPTATIAGSNTGLILPYGVVLDGAGDIYVANTDGNSIIVYAPGANGNATPMAMIMGSNTGVHFPSAIAFF
jgi:hypothetical protein